MSIKLPRKVMESILFGDNDRLGNLIEDRLVDTSRWSEHHTIVFFYEGKHYEAFYSCGLTEYQCEDPWECQQEVECWEVRQVEKVVKVWERVE